MRCAASCLALLALLLPGIAQAGAITIAKPWIRYLLPSIPAAGYLVLQNDSAEPALLTGAASPACGGGVMLHQSTDTSGMAAMMMVPSVTIPAHGALVLAPGGYHLMCMQPRMQPGSTIQLTLSLAGGARLAVTMPVYGAQTAPP